MKKLLKLLATVISAIAIILLIKETGENFYSGFISVPIYVFYKDKVGELYSEIKVFLGEDGWKSSQKKLEKSGNLQDDTLIRISFAYLFRIKIGDKYFLVPNSRTGKYQPVGGAYKFGVDEAKYLVDKFSAKDDNRIKVNEITERDYRLLIKNKNLKDFVKRFDNTLDRENIDNLSREFIEEIFNTNILRKDIFGDLVYSYCGRHISNVEKKAFGLYELLLADIVEVDLTDNQEGLFKALMDVNSKQHRFASSEEINNLGMDYDNQDLADTIANHTPKILNENNDQLSKKIKYKYKRKYKSPITIPL